MKIRIKGNSLRLRLSQFEVSQVEERGQVSDHIDFGLNSLTYSLKQSLDEQANVSFENNIIAVFIPKKTIVKWFNIEEVGFREELILQNGTVLNLLVEKDFQCLTVRKGEDESDLFQNPGQAHDK